MKRACAVCGRPFQPRHARHRRCPEHPAGVGPSTLAAREPAYRRLRAEILAANPVCVYCGAPATTVDHVIPVAKGGTSDPGNLVAACIACNASKQARDVRKENP